MNRQSPPAWCSIDDCDYRQSQTAWGATLIDSLHGIDPEVLTLAAPADGLYTLAVTAYRADSTTNAQLRVTNGTRVLLEDTIVLTTGEEWIPLTVRVNGRSISATVVDTVAQLPGSCWGP